MSLLAFIAGLLVPFIALLIFVFVKFWRTAKKMKPEGYSTLQMMGGMLAIGRGKKPK